MNVKKSIVPLLFIVLFVHGMKNTLAATIHFSGLDSSSSGSITPDSVYIKNTTMGKDTTLVGIMDIDLNVMTTISNSTKTGIISGFQLGNNYPNSFSNETSFDIHLAKTQKVDLSLYNILGRKVTGAAMVLDSGAHTFKLEGAALANGVYFISIKTQGQTKTLKILKNGQVSGKEALLHYNGRAANVQPSLGKTTLTTGDNFLFIGYAKGFVTDSLINQSPTGGETFQFMFTPFKVQIGDRWRGFNLMGMFTLEWDSDGYIEDDFQMISEMGFNFVRLPIDYRIYTEENDWNEFIDDKIYTIDDAVVWGQIYGIHVCINLHRAPGYCVNPPSQALPPDQDKSLWTDPEAQQAFANHWGMLAERYKDIPSENLSFNLVNEPSITDEQLYINAVQGAIDTIRAISPERIIITDGLGWGNTPVSGLIDENIVQSPHFYNPFNISHYKAEWVDGSDSWPEPTWPIYYVPNILFGNGKGSLKTPLKLNGDFKSGTKFILHVYQVSTNTTLIARADNKTIFTKNFTPGPGEGEWEQVIYQAEWNIYQNIYNKNYVVTLESDAALVSFEATTGDWISWSYLTIIPPAGSGLETINLNPGITDWGVPQAGSYNVLSNGEITVNNPPAGFEDKFDSKAYLNVWKEIESHGIPVFAGEWGVYKYTPHDVTLAFMESRLKELKQAGFGWALWNFRGGFGILDSDRDDVDYENFRGHKLDRDMLELLQKY